jgi:uncharacterized Ntn-hydrolase superfamily protein
MTYSIVARDPDTGELGVAVQSHWFAVGPVVPWARPGVGAVATQANVNVSFGPRALHLLAQGLDPQAVVDRLTGEDPDSAGRQLAVVDSQGRVAAFTGQSCLGEAGHATGDGVSCQANIMASAQVWPAMLETYEATEGSLTVRLLAALDAAEAEGGDLRGRQSAAIVVVASKGQPWETETSLHVEDHPDPLVELRRLVNLQAAYRIAYRADDLLNQERLHEAARFYIEASELAPDKTELRFWAGIGTAQLGDIDAGAALVAEAIEAHPGWRVLLERLPADQVPGAAPILARLGATGRPSRA